MKRTIFFIPILLLLMAGAAFGQDDYIGGDELPEDGLLFWWSGIKADKSWDILANWWDNRPRLPGPNDMASIDNPLPMNCLIGPRSTGGSNAECLELHVGDYPANSGIVPLVAHWMSTAEP